MLQEEFACSGKVLDGSLNVNYAVPERMRPLTGYRETTAR